jgi:hypothetical protein
MTDSITVAAFVVGLVLIIASLIGKELKIAAVEMPALSRWQRLIVGVLGAILVIFGLTEGRGFNLMTVQQSATTPAPAVLSASAEGLSSISQGEPSTQINLQNSGVALPPEFAGNIRSAKAKYGCGVLLGVASSDSEQLSVCGLMPSLPEEWITRVKYVNVDCATIASDRIIVEVWTGANYSGDTWGYTFGCPTPPTPATP